MFQLGVDILRYVLCTTEVEGESSRIGWQIVQSLAINTSHSGASPRIPHQQLRFELAELTSIRKVRALALVMRTLNQVMYRLAAKIILAFLSFTLASRFSGLSSQTAFPPTSESRIGTAFTAAARSWSSDRDMRDCLCFVAVVVALATCVGCICSGTVGSSVGVEYAVSRWGLCSFI